MAKLAIRLIALCVSILLYWLLVEEWGFPVWFVVATGLGLLLVGALRGSNR